MIVDRHAFEDIVITVGEVEAQMLSDTIEDAINHVGYPPSIREQLELLSKDLINQINSLEGSTYKRLREG